MFAKYFIKKKWLLLEIHLFLKLGLPMVYASLLQFTLNIVDTAVVGSFSTLELAGLAAGNGIYFFVTVIGIGLFNSLDLFFGKYFGKKDLHNTMKLMVAALIVAAIISLFSVIVLYVIANYYEYFGATEEITTVTKSYLKLVNYSIPFSLLYIVFQKFNQAFGNASKIAWLMFYINILNLISDIVLVYGIEGWVESYGSSGAAVSTLIGRIVMLIFGIYFTYVHFQKLLTKWGREVSLQISNLNNEFKNIFYYGIPIACQVGVELFAFSFITTLSAGFGKVFASSHQIVFQISALTFMIPLGLSTAISIRVSSLRAKNFLRISHISGWIGIFISGFTMLVASIVLLLFPESIINKFTSDDLVIIESLKIIFLCALFQIFDGVQVAAAGALRGASHMRKPLYGNIIGHYFFGIPMGLWLSYPLGYKLYGLWVGLALGLFVTALVNLFYWARTLPLANSEPS